VGVSAINIKFYDTNAILELQQNIFKEDFFISSITLQELENIKVSYNKDENTKYKARKMIHLLDRNSNKYKVIIFQKSMLSILEEFGMQDTPDCKIMACVKAMDDPNVIFVTNDLCCRTIAEKIFKLKVEKLENKDNAIYKGYKYISGTTAEINACMENLDYNELCINEYIVIRDIDQDNITELRYDGTKLVPLKLPDSRVVKGKNSLQRCALDLLNNSNIPIVAIIGGVGSGKTFLSMQMGIYKVVKKGEQSNVLGCREPIGEGRDIGFLPGTQAEKTGNYFTPLIQQLDGGEQELEELLEKGILTTTIPYFMKGTTYNDTIILCDEAEDLSEKQVHLIGTRLGEKSRIFFSGDYKQAIFNCTYDNPLIKMCNAFKNDPNFGCIYLEEDIRSKASAMFSTLFID